MKSPRPWAAVLLLALAGCSHRPPMMLSADEFPPRPEKEVLVALREVHADDRQRAEVLRAFDESQPRLRALADESEALLGQWRGLDRADADFAARAQSLAERWGASARERMLLTAAFEGRVAAVLDGDQWRSWRDFWSRPRFGPGQGGGLREGGSAPRRGGGRR